MIEYALMGCIAALCVVIMVLLWEVHKLKIRVNNSEELWKTIFEIDNAIFKNINDTLELINNFEKSTNDRFLKIEEDISLQDKEFSEIFEDLSSDVDRLFQNYMDMKCEKDEPEEDDQNVWDDIARRIEMAWSMEDMRCE